jgi:hypothetical protein
MRNPAAADPQNAAARRRLPYAPKEQRMDGEDGEIDWRMYPTAWVQRFISDPNNTPHWWKELLLVRHAAKVSKAEEAKANSRQIWAYLLLLMKQVMAQDTLAVPVLPECCALHCWERDEESDDSFTTVDGVQYHRGQGDVREKDKRARRELRHSLERIAASLTYRRRHCGKGGSDKAISTAALILRETVQEVVTLEEEACTALPYKKPYYVKLGEQLKEAERLKARGREEEVTSSKAEIAKMGGVQDATGTADHSPSAFSQCATAALPHVRPPSMGRGSFLIAGHKRESPIVPGNKKPSQTSIEEVALAPLEAAVLAMELTELTECEDPMPDVTRPTSVKFDLSSGRHPPGDASWAGGEDTERPAGSSDSEEEEARKAPGLYVKDDETLDDDRLLDDDEVQIRCSDSSL